MSAPQTTDGQRMIEEAFRFLGRFICYPSPHTQVAHALWVLHTHLMPNWDITPRIAFLSPEPGSGKSRALEVTGYLVTNPVHAVNASPAYMFRKVGFEQDVTILFDEIDAIFGPKARENEELRGLLNAGFQRGAVVGRCVVRNKEVVVEEFPAYCAVALAGLGSLPDTIRTRSIIIRMRRRHAGEKVEHFRRRIHGPEGDRIRAMISDWAETFQVTAWPDLPEGINDRDADIWEPLIAIADAIGGEWPARAREAALALVAAGKKTEPSLGIRLHSDLRTIFGSAPALSTKMILAELNQMDEAPWGDMRGKPLDSRGLANLLKEYGVTSKTVRIGNATPKGYSRADLVDVWRRYLPVQTDDCDTSATSATAATGDDEALSHAADVADVAEL